MGLAMRTQHAMLLSLVGFTIYSSRMILNIALLDMVDRKDTNVEDRLANSNVTCYSNIQEPVKDMTIDIDITVIENSSAPSASSLSQPKRFDWTESEISIINVAYFVGYVPAIVPGTVLASRMGFYNYLTVMMCSTCFLIGTFPIVTIKTNAYGAVVSRVLLGAIQAPATAVVSGSWYYWCLCSEITTTNSIWQIGGTTGMITVGAVGGMLLTVGCYWPSIFYLFTIIYCVVLVLFIIRADDKPEQTTHQFNNIRPWRFSNGISSEELMLLINDRPIQAAFPNAPWSAIVLSSDVWFYTIAWFCATGTNVAFASYAPRYMQYFMLIDIGDITKFIGLQAIICLPLFYLFSKMTDSLRKRFSTPRVRKAMYIFPMLALVVGFCILAIEHCNRYSGYCALALIGISNGLLLTASCKPIPNELGGKFAGQIYAFSNTVSNIASIVSPLVVGILLNNGPIYLAKTWYYPGIFMVSMQIIGGVFILFPKLTYLPFTKASNDISLLNIDECKKLMKSSETN